MARPAEVLDLGRLALLMRARRWTQYELAKRSGVDEARLSKILNYQEHAPSPARSGIPYLLARAFDVPIEAVLTGGRKHWERLDFWDQERYLQVTEDMTYADSILACSRTLCSYLLPDDLCLSLTARQFAGWGLPPDAIRERLAHYPAGYRQRRASRTAREYAHQVIGPLDVLRDAARQEPSHLAAIRDQLRAHDTVTCLGLIPPKPWGAFERLVAKLTGFDDWAKVNVAGDYVGVVWHRTEIHCTYHQATITQLRGLIEEFAEKNSPAGFLTSGGGSEPACRDPGRMRSAQRDLDQFLSQEFPDPARRDRARRAKVGRCRAGA